MPDRHEPYRPASFDLAEADIAQTYPVAVIHDDAAEAALLGASIEREAKIEEWRSITAAGLEDAGQFEGESRSQPQTTVTSPLGHHALGWELLDLIEYRVTTLDQLGPGHIRNIRRDWLRQHAEVESWHLDFCESAIGAGS